MSASGFVWGTWAVLTVATFAFVGVYGRDCPFMDEWMMLPALAGEVGPVGWAAEWHSEHWYPVPRLLYLALWRASGDLRAAMAANALLLSVAAAILIRAAGRVRGRTSPADAFFPLVFLHAGHWENLLMAYQVCFTLPVALGAGLVGLAAGWDGRVWRVGAAAVLSVLLTGCGAAGAFLAAAGAAWLVGLGVGAVRSRRPGVAVLAWGGVMAVVGVLADVAANHPGSPFGSATRRAIDLAGFFARLSAMTFGPTAWWLWPAGAVVAMTAAVGGLGAAARGWRAGDRTRTAGLGAVLGLSVALIAGLTWGRGWAGPEAAALSRYGALLLPGAAAAYLLVVGTPGRVGPVLVAAAAGCAALAWPCNLAVGLDHAGRVSGHIDALARDIRGGLPPELIAERYNWQLFLLYPGVHRDLAEATRIGFAPFRDPGSPVAVRSVEVDIGVVEPGRAIDLPPTPAVVAVRVRGVYVPAENRVADSRVRWREAGTGWWREERFQVVKNAPAAVVVRVWGTPTAVEVLPGCGPAGYRITGIELVVAETNPRAGPATSGGD